METSAEEHEEMYSFIRVDGWGTFDPPTFDPHVRKFFGFGVRVRVG